MAGFLSCMPQYLHSTFSGPKVDDAVYCDTPCEDKQDYTKLNIGDDSKQATVLYGTSFAMLHERFDAEKTLFEGSEAHRQIRKHFSAILRKQASRPTFKITNVIFLGLGSLSGMKMNDWTSKMSDSTIKQLMARSMGQLIMFEWYLSLLKQHYEIPNIYFQDPVFSTLDKQFLESLGYKVIDSPASNNVITEETFLFAPVCPVSIIYPSLLKSFPAIYIGRPLHDEDWYIRICYKENPWLRKMMKEFLKKRITIEQIQISTMMDENAWGSMYFRR